jgi:GNAT superfamily N-acetyltransferase
LLLDLQDGRGTQLTADGGAHGAKRYRRRVERNDPSPPGPRPAVPPIRPVRPDELALLPAIEAAADTMFEPFGIGPLPGPGTVEEFAAALVVLVAGDPPVGLCRIDAVTRVRDGHIGVHLEQLSVLPDHAGRGIGRALLRAGCEWAKAHGYDDITLATYRDIPWNGPFYASEGFAERGSVDGFWRAHGGPPEEPVMARGGVRVLMGRRL